MLKAILLIVAMASPVYADHIVPFPDASKILVPPAQYDPRIKGPPKFTIKFIPHKDMYRVCSNNGTIPNIGPKVLACTKVKLRLIYAPIGMSTALKNAVLRHERGHGWGWTHPNTTYGTEGLHEEPH